MDQLASRRGKKSGQASHRSSFFSPVHSCDPGNPVRGHTIGGPGCDGGADGNELLGRLSARQQTPAQTSRFTEGDAHAAILGSLAEEPGGGAEPSATTRMTLQNGQDGDQRAVAALSIEAASALKHSSTRPHAATPPRTGSYVFGPHGTEGISPDKLIAHQRRTLTHSWGPKPSSLLRPCRMREGNVTKRIRMDRDRLAGVGSKKLWAADGNAHAGGDRSGARSATFFRPVPLSVVQQDKRLVGLPLQRTVPVSTDPVRDGNNPAGEWALRQVVAQAGGGGPAISVYGSMGVGIWPRKQRI